ncbi:MAG: type II secretion system minor pseudopilin GspK [Candidatus Competibacteraceae bacterium]
MLARDDPQNPTDHPRMALTDLPPTPSVEGGVLTGHIRDLQGCFNLNNLWQPDPAKAATTPKKGQKNSQPNTQQNDPQSAQQNNQPEEALEDEKDAEDTEDNSSAKAPQPPSLSPSSSSDSSSSQADHAGLNKTQMEVLQRLLESLELKPTLAQAIADWIDPDSDPLFPDGAEDSDYMVRNPPYLAANRPLTSISELRLIKGVDQTVYDKLAPLVCALPPGTPFNINTAPAPVLAALGEGLDLETAKNLVESRSAKGYANVDDFLNVAKLTVNAQVKALLSTDSQYFLLRAEARVGDGRAMLYSTLHHDKNGIRVLQRSFGNQD